MARRSRFVSSFTVGPAVAVLAAALLVAVGRWRLSALSIGLSLTLTAATYLILCWIVSKDRRPTTAHAYGLRAPAGPALQIGELTRRLEARGYRLAAVSVSDEGNEGGGVPPAAALVGAAVRLREQRADRSDGSASLRLRVLEEGGLCGVLDAEDAGPGLYDELAQFAVVALGELIPGLEVQVAMGEPWRAAAALGDELPAQPHGLALVG